MAILSKRNCALRGLILSFTLIAGFCVTLKAEDIPPRLEELFPDTTLIALALPDLDAARKSADASRLGDLFKQPEMREFLDPLITRMRAAYIEARAANPMIPTLDELDNGVLSSEIGACIYSRGGGNQPGIVFSIRPKDDKAFEAILTNAAKPFLQGQPFPKEPFPLGDGDNAPGVLYARGRLLICSPMSEMATITDRIGDAQKRVNGTLATAESFKDARAGMRETAGWVYLNPHAALTLTDEINKDQLGPQMVKARFIASALGLDNVNAMMIGLSFAGGEPALESYLGTTDGAPKGIFTLLGTKGPGKEMLQLAAENAPYVASGSFNFSQLIPMARSIATTVDPNAANMLNNGLAMVSGMLGFDIEKDLLNNMESEMVFAQTAHDTGLPLSFSPGLVGAIKLKDSAKVEECLKKLTDFATGLLAQQRVPSFLGKFKTADYKGAHIYYFNQIVNISGSLVFTVVKDKLIWGDSLNAVRRSIDQLGTGSNILSNKSFQTSLARVSGKPFDPNSLPLSFAYAEDYGSGGGVLLLTGLGVVSGTAAVSGLSELAAQGRLVAVPPGVPTPFDEFAKHPGGRTAMNIAEALDLHLWPDEEFFVKRRQPHAAASIKTAKGWSSRMEFPPPSPHYGSLGGAAPVLLVALAAGATVPVWAMRARAMDQQARVFERQAQIQAEIPQGRVNNRVQGEINNLRQLYLAMQMYEIEKNKLPADPADLFPTYINDLAAFKSKANPDQDAAYTLITGVKSDDADAMLAYENVPDNAGKKRSILKTDGKVESVSEEDFKTLLKETEEIVTKQGRKFGTVPMSVKEISKKVKK